MLIITTLGVWCRKIKSLRLAWEKPNQSIKLHITFQFTLNQYVSVIPFDTVYIPYKYLLSSKENKDKEKKSIKFRSDRIFPWEYSSQGWLTLPMQDL